VAAVTFATQAASAHQVEPRGPHFLAGVLLVAAKDLRIEASSRVATNQVVPFAGIVLLMFAFATDPDRSSLRSVAPGMFWTAVVLAAVLAASRSATIETDNNARDGLRLSGVDSAAIFLGKAAAILAELLVLEAVLLVGLIVVYGFRIEHPGVLVASAVAASAGIAAVDVLYATLAASTRVRDTLLPLLTLPLLAPVALGGTRAWTAAAQVGPTDGGRWVQLLAVFACVFTSFGIAAYDALLEES
jgi:heme exporter protein B